MKLKFFVVTACVAQFFAYADTHSLGNDSITHEEGWLLKYVKATPQEMHHLVVERAMANPRSFIVELDHALVSDLEQSAMEGLLLVMWDVALRTDDREVTNSIKTRFETLYLTAPPRSFLRRRVFDDIFGIFHKTQANWDLTFERSLLEDARREITVRSILLLGLGETAEGEVFLREQRNHDDENIVLFADAALARRGDKEAEERVIRKAKNHIQRMTEGQIKLFFMIDMRDSLERDSVEFWEQHVALRFIGSAATLIVSWQQLMADIPLHKPSGIGTASLWSGVLRDIRMHLDAIGSKDFDVPGWLSRENLDLWWGEHKEGLHKIFERNEPLHRYMRHLNYPGKPSWWHL